MIEMAGQKGDVTHLAFSPDGRILATSGGGRGVEMWDVATANRWGQHTGVKFSDGPVAFHPTMPVCFASYLHGIPEIETDTKKARALLIDGKGINFFWTTAMLPDGSGFVCHCNGNHHFPGVLWQLRWEPGEMLRIDWSAQLGLASPRAASGALPRVIRVAPNGKTIVTLDATQGPWAPENDPVRLAVRSATDGKLLQFVKLPARTALTLAVSPDSKTLLTCQGNSLSVWKADDVKAKPRCVRNDNRSRFTGVAFHPSGRYLAATSNDATVKLYDTTTWQIAKTFTWNIGRMRSIAFSPDGTLAAAGSDTGKVVVWDVDV